MAPHFLPSFNKLIAVVVLNLVSLFLFLESSEAGSRIMNSRNRVSINNPPPDVFGTTSIRFPATLICSGVKPIVAGSICKGSWGWAGGWTPGSSGTGRFKDSSSSSLEISGWIIFLDLRWVGTRTGVGSRLDQRRLGVGVGRVRFRAGMVFPAKKPW